MNDDKVIYLTDIRDELQSFMHYFSIRDAFEALWEAWIAMNKRRRYRTKSFFQKAEKDGFMPRKDAESFCNYIHSAHFWKCLE